LQSVLTGAIDYERRDLISSRELVQTQIIETGTAGHFGHLNNHENSSLSLGTGWELPNESSFEFDFLHGVISPPAFTEDQVLPQFDLFPRLSSPAFDISIDTLPSVLVPPDEILESYPVKARSICQCQYHSTNCVQTAHFAGSEDTMCTCCWLGFDWSDGPTITLSDDSDLNSPLAPLEWNVCRTAGAVRILAPMRPPMAKWAHMINIKSIPWGLQRRVFIPATNRFEEVDD
jgi:hypothetical protein